MTKYCKCGRPLEGYETTCYKFCQNTPPTSAGLCSLDPLVGQQFYWQGDVARVMAVAEGYAMARTTRRHPFVVVADLITPNMVKTAQEMSNIAAETRPASGRSLQPIVGTERK